MILDAQGMERALDQLAQEALKRHRDATRLALVGIRTRGEFLAKRLAQRLKDALGKDIPVGALDITLYRDDFHIRPKPARASQIEFSVVDKDIILVDDVLFTGRTTRAALNELADLGRASSISLAVLVDRGHRELPIKADFVGAIITTDRDETVRVRLRELDGVDQVVAVGV